METPLPECFVDRIPDELLSEIFLTGQRSRHNHERMFASDETEDDVDEVTTNFEVLVSHVSQHWRDVALSTPQLWSRIDISAERRLTKPLVYLRRCSGCPLTARACLFRNPPTADMDLFHEIIQLFVSKIASWSRISIQFGAKGDERFFFDPLHRASAPLLAYLSMTSITPAYGFSNESQASRDAKFPPLLAGGTPRLKLLRLSGRAFNLTDPPTHMVTTLHLEQTFNGRMFSLDKFRRLLSQCGQLINLSVEGSLLTLEDWFSLRESLPIVEMPSLRSLRVTGITGEIYSGLLLAMSAPQLESLFLKKAIPTDLDAFLDVCHSSQPRFPQLNSLTLDDFEFHVPVYQRWFSIFPGIKHITVMDTPMRVPTIVLLLSKSINEQNSPLPADYLPCPELETLTILLHYDEPEVLFDAVFARAGSGHPLKKLRLGVGSDTTEAEKQDIHARLNDFVTVEMFEEIEPWPLDLGYVDEDDRWNQ